MGIKEVEDKIRAMDYLGKVDPKLYTMMLTSMLNETLKNVRSSIHPKALAGVYRVASSWSSSWKSIPSEQHSAFVTDRAFGTKAKDPEKVMKSPSVNLEFVIGKGNEKFVIGYDEILCLRKNRLPRHGLSELEQISNSFGGIETSR